jgi:hypothetical protein
MFFAPGVKIYATTPNNEYQYLRYFNGCAKHCWSCCFDSFVLSKLSAKQVKQILMESGVAITTEVIVGGKQRQTFVFNIIQIW